MTTLVPRVSHDTVVSPRLQRSGGEGGVDFGGADCGFGGELAVLAGSLLVLVGAV